eukprot:XP_016865672.1 uncharacterized protein C6orf10 isoform X3 [Homo sapiens]
MLDLKLPEINTLESCSLQTHLFCLYFSQNCRSHDAIHSPYSRSYRTYQALSKNHCANSRTYCTISWIQCWSTFSTPRSTHGTHNNFTENRKSAGSTYNNFAENCKNTSSSHYGQFWKNHTDSCGYINRLHG